MCGIAGIVLKGRPNRPFVTDIVRRLERALVHRGPDSSGMHIEDGCGFTMRRLAIVGITGGDQPIYTDDRSKGIVFNGEIYNYLNLKTSYQQQGEAFHTQTDTEVVLRGFARDGVEGFNRLEGMFAFCLWNQATGEIYVARDAFGMKPLYIYEDERMIVFSSEITAILALEETDKALNPIAVKDFLTFRYVLAPHTIYKRIRRAAPGTHVSIGPSGCRERAFADLARDAEGGRPLSYAAAQEQLFHTLVESVRSHLIGEVPIALLLSGGLDSSILAALLHRINAPMRCFSVGFPEVNEFAYSNAVTEKYGFPAQRVEITTADIVRSFPTIIGEMDEPLADAAQFPLYLLCHEIKKHATVVLSGEGADELFGGYPQYLTNDLQLTATERLPHFLRASYYFLETDHLMQNPPEDGGWHRTQKYFRGDTVLEAMSNYDLATWMPDDLMMKADKIMMRHSLEGRFPYLNRSLLSLVRSFPTHYLIGAGGVFKRILKDSFAGLLPDLIINRPKMGFSVPIGLLLKELQHRYRTDLEELRRHEIGSILNLDATSALFDRFLQGDGTTELQNWTLFTLTSWVASHQRHAV